MGGRWRLGPRKATTIFLPGHTTGELAHFVEEEEATILPLAEAKTKLGGLITGW